MTESFGAQAIPITAAPGAPVTVAVSASDPLLSYLGSYLRAAINARLSVEFGTLMFQNASPPAVTAPIGHVFEHDPELDDFNQKDLPALYLFRSSDGNAGIEQLAEDWTLTTETIRALWVLPSATQDKTSSRVRFASKLFHLAGALIDANRDPAWIVAGDADENAADQGSSLATFGKFFRLRLSRGAVRKPLAIKVEGLEPMNYPSFEALFEVKERLLVDPARNATLVGLHATVTTGGDDPPLTLGTYTLDRT